MENVRVFKEYCDVIQSDFGALVFGKMVVRIILLKNVPELIIKFHLPDAHL